MWDEVDVCDLNLIIIDVGILVMEVFFCGWYKLFFRRLDWIVVLLVVLEEFERGYF